MTERVPAPATTPVQHEDLNNPYDLPGYRKISKIGEGTYGVVFKAEQESTKEFVAIKKIRLNMQEGIPTTTLREIAVLKELRHDNIIKMTDMIQKNNAVYLVFEYSEVDLRKYMEKVGRRGLTADHIRSFMHQLLRGLHYCHTRRILHRDLKPQNLLIDRHGRLTIADLGLARSFGVPMRAYTHQVVTLWYRAPEILLGSDYYSTAVDMWSVGCIMAEMIAFRPLFPGATQIEELFHIFQLRGTPTEEVWPGVSTLRDYNAQFPPWKPRDLKTLLLKCHDSIEMPDLAFDLLERLLTYDPSHRITARSAEEHDFFYSDISKLQF
ncbi:kinase-like domain-containing protein [Mycotypha africana]|uniref:kinase-like domain-containing protein n=1 Tax=Mycotypha africana TaxID=64632 RepID=UPI002300F463|nr:kinase-like domain-containing protein [Mycotypha africana]KAI8968206.1 kinase-like domain-containing protein [Mycotypha africana]